VLQRRAWARDPVFDWLAAAGKVSAAEMYRTFNCGIGMVVVVAPTDVDAALAQLRATGETATVIGALGRGSRGVVIEE
jgi:phosphoribosylformylglycinamidine cyclo-ligase